MLMPGIPTDGCTREQTTGDQKWSTLIAHFEHFVLRELKMHNTLNKEDKTIGKKNEIGANPLKNKEHHTKPASLMKLVLQSSKRVLLIAINYFVI
ncbi:hypothetical protein DPMN_060385 [Dreissena polymorpha]|uniref:Uncharacterized protein n=1 Tax=Dreissena polymorpha TaxID=45954 RepID=A0A9D4C5L7_DREPO|nr:hypothetical protein DPMN_060385 [Dreissena polymorpha]